MKSYTTEQKETAIEAYLSGKLKVKQICNEYGMSRTSFYNWLY